MEKQDKTFENETMERSIAISNFTVYRTTERTLRVLLLYIRRLIYNVWSVLRVLDVLDKLDNIVYPCKMRCLMCLNYRRKMKEYQKYTDIELFKKIAYVFPELVIPDNMYPVFICIACLEQIPFFYTLKKSSLQKCCRLKQFNTLLKGSSNFDNNELKIIITSKDPLLSEDQELISIKEEEEEEEVDGLSQEIKNDGQKLNYLDDSASSRSGDVIQDNEKEEYYEFVDVNKFTEKDTETTSNNTQQEEQAQQNTETTQFKCDCGKIFNSQKNLTGHLKVHSDNRPYECSTCQKSFKTRAHLNNHNLSHTGEKLYECDICNKTFSRMGNMTTHKRIHSDERLYECSECEKSFKQSAHLFVHMRKHTGEKPYGCSQCGYKSTQISSLKRHFLFHTREKPFGCMFCDKAFITKGNLQKHVGVNHSDRSKKISD